MKIMRAEYLGMCFGVRDAITLAMEQAGSGPLTILGELVHNETVLNELRLRGIQLVSRPEEVQTQAVLITAHGTSNGVIRQAQARGLNVSEATCPLVHVAHRALRELVRQGYYPVVIGVRQHVEVRGMTGDLEAFDVVLSEADVAAMQEHSRIGIVAQTTQPQERVRELVEQIRRRFPLSDVRFVDTVCQPTKQRQNAAVKLAHEADVVVVIGGANSNNTRELVQTCRRWCERVYHVQSAADLRSEWFDEAQTVGVTAGTSTPDALIQGVEEWLRCEAVAREREPKNLQAA